MRGDHREWDVAGCRPVAACRRRPQLDIRYL